jgi:hypothetical protein
MKDKIKVGEIYQSVNVPFYYVKVIDVSDTHLITHKLLKTKGVLL